jgi:hypothetical protein
MLILNNVISDSEIIDFKQYFDDNFSEKYINWTVNDQTIDHRLLIDENSPQFEIIRRIVSKNFVNSTSMWAAYQRQSRPHNIHIDDYGAKLTDQFRYTYILAMDSVPEFKAIVWKETCWDNDKLHEFVTKWGRLKKFKKPTSNISEIEDLEHTYDANQEAYMADYLTLDKIYTYQTGTACLFDATQLHCTSNWIKYNKFPHRELLQIHVTTSEPVDLS